MGGWVRGFGRAVLVLCPCAFFCRPLIKVLRAISREMHSLPRLREAHESKWAVGLGLFDRMVDDNVPAEGRLDRLAVKM